MRVLDRSEDKTSAESTQSCSRILLRITLSAPHSELPGAQNQQRVVQKTGLRPNILSGGSGLFIPWLRADCFLFGRFILQLLDPLIYIIQISFQICRLVPERADFLLTACWVWYIIDWTILPCRSVPSRKSTPEAPPAAIAAALAKTPAKKAPASGPHSIASTESTAGHGPFSPRSGPVQSWHFSRLLSLPHGSSHDLLYL